MNMEMEVKKKAQRDSCKTEPMPHEVEKFILDRVISQKEFDLIGYGSFPQQMEDRWFIYYDTGKIYFHRSWTGLCIFIADIDKIDSGYIISDVFANRNKEQYRSTGIERDKTLVNILIDGLLNQSNM